MIRLFSLAIVASLLIVSPGVFAVGLSDQETLSVQVVVSDSSDFIKEWMVKPPHETIHLKPVKDIVPGQTIYVAVVVSGYGVNNNGQIDLVGDFIIKSPDGTTQVENNKISTHKKNFGGTGGFIMLDPAIILTFEEEDPRGTFVIKTVIKDNVLKKTGLGEYRISLRDSR